MQIFIPSKKRAIVLPLSRWLVGAIGLMFIGLLYAMFNAGHNHAISTQSERTLNENHHQFNQLIDEMEEQHDMIVVARNEAQSYLDVLAQQVGHLRARVIRLDALGSRLVDIANLSELEFDINSSIGLGGPLPASVQESIDVKDFMASLDNIAMTVQDRSDKLSAMGDMLMDSSLQDKLSITGYPVSSSGWISSLYGLRTDPMTGRKEYHHGVDLAGKTGDPIYTVASGIVTWSGPYQSYGKMVEISHGNGYMTRYAHNNKNIVVVGETVQKGMKIANMGSSGRSTGPHVHFEVLKYGKPVNPKKYLAELKK